MPVIAADTDIDQPAHQVGELLDASRSGTAGSARSARCRTGPASVIRRISSSRALGLGVPGSSVACSSESSSANDTAIPGGSASPDNSGRSRESTVPLVRIENGVPLSAKRGDDARHQPVATLGALVGVGVGAQRDVLTPPRRPEHLAPQDLGDVDLDHDLGVEVVPGVELQVAVGAPGEAVDTAVGAAAVRVDRPVERDLGHRGHPVQRRTRGDLVEGDAGELRRPNHPDPAGHLGHARAARGRPHPAARRSSCPSHRTSY